MPSLFPFFFVFAYWRISILSTPISKLLLPFLSLIYFFFFLCRFSCLYFCYHFEFASMLLHCFPATHLFHIFLNYVFFSTLLVNFVPFLLISSFFNYLSFLLNIFFFSKFFLFFFLNFINVSFFQFRSYISLPLSIFSSLYFPILSSSFLLLCLFQPFQKQLRVLFRISKVGSRKNGWIFVRRNAMDFVIGANAPISTWMPLS